MNKELKIYFSLEFCLINTLGFMSDMVNKHQSVKVKSSDFIKQKPWALVAQSEHKNKILSDIRNLGLRYTLSKPNKSGVKLFKRLREEGYDVRICTSRLKGLNGRLAKLKKKAWVRRYFGEQICKEIIFVRAEPVLEVDILVAARLKHLATGLKFRNLFLYSQPFNVRRKKDKSYPPVFRIEEDWSNFEDALKRFRSISIT